MPRRDAEVLIAVARRFRTSFKQIREALPGTYPFCGVLAANCVINSGGGIRKLQAKGEICGSAKSR
jgi:hypothetical protein